MALVKDTTAYLKQIYRHTFDMRYSGLGSVALYTLIKNPEDMSQDEPARNTVTQTLGGAYVTDFGMGIPQVVISGTTGYKARRSAEGDVLDGYEAFQKFRNTIYRNYIEKADPNFSLNWYNWEDDEFYEIQPQNFRLQRNKQASLLYRYEFRFTCLRKLKNSRQQVTHDYLINQLGDPAKRQMQQNVDQLKLGAATSAVSEFIHRVFGG